MHLNLSISGFLFIRCFWLTPEFTLILQSLKLEGFNSLLITSITSDSEIPNWNSIASNGVLSSQAISMIRSVCIKLNSFTIILNFYRVLCDFKVFRFFLIRHFIQSSQHHSQSRICFEKFSVIIHKIPKEGIPFFRPAVIRVIAHLFDIIASADVRFCTHFSTVRKAAHPINIRNHYPILRIDEHLHKPLINVVWIDFQQIHKVGENH